MERAEIRRMEAALSLLLRGGVLLSAVLIILGLVLMAVMGDTSSPYGIPTLGWVLGFNPFFSPAHVLFLGFFVLIATPVLRIVASTLMFLKVRDAAFTVITSLVLLILLITFSLGVG